MQGVLIYNIPNLYWSVDDIRHTLRRKCGGARDNNGNCSASPDDNTGSKVQRILQRVRKTDFRRMTKTMHEGVRSTFATLSQIYQGFCHRDDEKENCEGACDADFPADDKENQKSSPEKFRKTMKIKHSS